MTGTQGETRTPSDPRSTAARWYDKGYAAGRESVAAPPVTVTDEMVERAARLIFAAMFYQSDRASEDDYQFVKAVYERAARAALSAALNPEAA